MLFCERAGSAEQGRADEFIACSLGMLVGGHEWEGIGRTCALEADRLPTSWLGECGNASATYPRTSNHAGI